jgi:hypothetical protein
LQRALLAAPQEETVHLRVPASCVWAHSSERISSQQQSPGSRI